MRNKIDGAILLSLLLAIPSSLLRAGTAEAFNPAWMDELGWANAALWARPTGSAAWLEDLYSPWWQSRVAHPISDYSASKLKVGALRMDAALGAELTTHRAKKSWDVETSPTAINNVYTYTPGSNTQEKRTTRAGQNAYLNLGAHPIEGLTADIGAEFIGNYDQRYWFPVNDELRMYNDDMHAKIVRGEVKYDSKLFMVRGFEGVPIYGWIGKNDLFQLMPTQGDVEFYRRLSGSLTPRGGEARATTPFGTLTALGGTEIRWGYGPSAFARYDAPTLGSIEQSIVYRNEEIPFGLQNPDERRWALSYNVSGQYSERAQWHAGLLYQPFRIGQTYQTSDSATLSDRESVKRKDAFGATLRSEMHPARVIDHVGIGYTYQGLVAGNKHQLDLDGMKIFANGSLSAAYLYRQPVEEAVPTTFEGTANNPGAFLRIPRGPDDPFHVWWDNRKAHIASLTFVWNPTPGTPFFKYQRNVLEDWNINPDLEPMWTGALQYRMTHYPTNTDRLYYWDENRTLSYDPISYTLSGARATDHPFSSMTSLLRYRQGKWRVIADLSAGEALAGSGIAYTAATNFYKPSTIFVHGGLQAQYGPYKAFARYGQDVWGPVDYHAQLGWAYHKVYQLGASADFLRDFQAGVRYIGTRMTDRFTGSDTGAFNEYRLYLTYHFTFERNIEKKFRSVGRALPQAIPEAKVELSADSFTPDGTSADRVLSIYPQAEAPAGVLSWKLLVRNAQGELVRSWEGNGQPKKIIQWDGADAQGRLVPHGTYRVLLNAVDLYGNEVTSPAKSVTIRTLQGLPAEPVQSPATGKPYTLKTTAEGLRVTLSSLVLFDVGRYDLKASSREGLEQVVKLLKAYPTNSLRITGHTDAMGGNAYNQDLSEKRAQAVREYLAREGNINSSRINVVGYGEKRPVASNATEEGRQQNRRVEIDILK
jgi:outer membrane protein OmpA-like peptidoglycan-associated protein